VSKLRVTIDEVHEYLEQWYNHENWTDFNMAWDSGYTDYAAYLIWSAGAIDSTQCYEESRPIAQAIEALMKRYSEKRLAKDVRECFGDAEIYINPDTHEYAFIRNSDVDYLLSADEMARYGYYPAKEVYAYAQQYHDDMECIGNMEQESEAGIPVSVIVGETKLTDHFSQEYINAQCGRNKETENE
jgi:hypothetical protein